MKIHRRLLSIFSDPSVKQRQKQTQKQTQKRNHNCSAATVPLGVNHKSDSNIKEDRAYLYGMPGLLKYVMQSGS